MPYLTFLYTSFAKIFCQNYVKKNRKFASWVFTKNAVIRHKRKYRMYLSYEPKIHLCLTLMIYRLWHHKFIITAAPIHYCCIINLSLRHHKLIIAVAPLYLCSSINSLLLYYQSIIAASSIYCYGTINQLLQHYRIIVFAIWIYF